MPVLPFVVEGYGAEEWVYGLLLTLYSVFQFIGAPYLGAMSDRIGRKPVLLISQAGTLLCWVVFLIALFLPETPILGFALPLWIIALARIFDGITGGNTSVANAYVADITTREEKSYIFGYLGGIVGLGLIIGPGLGGVTASSSIGVKGTILTAMAISILALLSIFMWLKESHQPAKKGTVKRQSILQSIFILRRIRKVNPKPLIKLLFGMKFIFSTMMAFYISTIPLFLIDLFSFDERELGSFMLVVGIFLAFNQAFLAKRFVIRVGEFNTLLFGLLFSVIGLFCITITDNFWLYISFYYIMNLGISLVLPTFNSLIAIHANPEKQGEIMGISDSLNSFAMALFPVVAASIYGVIMYKVYFFITALPLAALLIALFMRKRLHIKN